MNVAATLGHHVGPLPVGVWLAGAVGGLYVAHKRSATHAPSAVAGTPGTPGTPATDATSSGGGDVVDPSPDAGVPVISPTLYITAPPSTGTLVPVQPPFPADGGGGSSSGDGATAAPTVPSGTTTHPGIPTAPASPRAVHEKPSAPSRSAKPRRRTYIVRPGDTLSSIGAKLGADWGAIYSANRGGIESTARRHGFGSSDGGHWIFPGEVLVIP